MAFVIPRNRTALESLVLAGQLAIPGLVQGSLRRQQEQKQQADNVLLAQILGGGGQQQPAPLLGSQQQIAPLLGGEQAIDDGGGQQQFPKINPFLTVGTETTVTDVKFSPSKNRFIAITKDGKAFPFVGKGGRKIVRRENGQVTIHTAKTGDLIDFAVDPKERVTEEERRSLISKSVPFEIQQAVKERNQRLLDPEPFKGMEQFLFLGEGKGNLPLPQGFAPQQPQQSGFRPQQQQPQLQPQQSFAPQQQQPNISALLGQFQTEGGRNAALGILTRQLETPLQRAQREKFEAETRFISQKPVAKDLSKTQLIGRLGTKIAEGTATDKEVALFDQLNRPSTQVTVNTGGLNKAVGEQIQDFKQAQRDINTFKKNPQNRDLNKDFNIGLETNSKGALQLNVEAKKAPTSEQINKKEFQQLLLSKVGKINNIVTKTKGLTGPITGPTRRLLAETVGGQQKFVELKQLLDSLIIRVYMLSGKQINETELRFLQSLQPQANDPTDTFDTRLKGFYGELESISGISDNLWNDLGIKTPDGQILKAAPKPLSPIEQERLRILEERAGQ